MGGGEIGVELLPVHRGVAAVLHVQLDPLREEGDQHHMAGAQPTGRTLGLPVDLRLYPFTLLMAPRLNHGMYPWLLNPDFTHQSLLQFGAAVRHHIADLYSVIKRPAAGN